MSITIKQQMMSRAIELADYWRGEEQREQVEAHLESEYPGCDEYIAHLVEMVCQEAA